ncbi:hypothetical protein [Mesorhizobium sp. C268A]|uniref:hypothetical protein n=1 Tax=Mesorhizobium sp. C268A TaxID=2956826 RepID=UPI00333C9169
MKTLGFLDINNVGSLDRLSGFNGDLGPSAGDPCRYESSPIAKQVPGAWARNVVPGAPTLENAYIKAAQELVHEGADAITGYCGFSVRYQQAIAEAVPVPVSMSSLLLLPMLLSTAPASKKIAVLTADSRALDDGIMAMLGITEQSRLIVEGLEGTATYGYMWAENGEIDVDHFLADMDHIVNRVRQHQDIAAILCECTMFSRTSHRIRRATGLPVYDTATNAALLMASVS